MNSTAEAHLARAKDYIAQGDAFYRLAKPEIEAAIAAGASQREVGRILLRSPRWVRDVIAWDGTGSLYAEDSDRRRVDMAKQVLRENPEVVKDEVFKAAGSLGERMVSRATPQDIKEAGATASAVVRPMVSPMASMGITLLIEQATDALNDAIGNNLLEPAALTQIDEALGRLRNAFAMATEMVVGA